MIVRELIEKLQTMPQDAEVARYDYDDRYSDVYDVAEVLPPGNDYSRTKVVIR